MVVVHLIEPVPKIVAKDPSAMRIFSFSEHGELVENLFGELVMCLFAPESIIQKDF